MQGSGAFLCLWEGESGASAHGEAGIGEPVGQDSLGVLTAQTILCSTTLSVDELLAMGGEDAEAVLTPRLTDSSLTVG